jgi:methylated-DNA-[protein]-cysteine S-methyltransferase
MPATLTSPTPFAAEGYRPTPRPATPTVLVATLPTPLGPLTLLAADGIVRAGGFTEDTDSLARRLAPDLRNAPLEPVADLGTITEALHAYFAGEVGALDAIPVQQHGAAFQQQVWEALRTLPPGEPATYKELAVRLGGAGRARAVGMGCATNSVSPIVPCHRVTRTDGRLAGYLWSLDRKRWLLDHERRHAPRG